MEEKEKHHETAIKEKNAIMTTRKKILIGGLGGITPVLMNLLVIDLELLLMKFTPIALIGYLIRVVILFYLGGIVAFLNKGETDAVRLFQLGITAPALLTAFMNGTNIDVPKVPMSSETEYHRSIDNDTGKMKFHIISQAFAQPTESDKIKIKRFSAPEESAVQQLFRGLFGSKPKNIWFVICGVHSDKEAALKQAEKIQNKGFKAEIYAPYGIETQYSVVIGDYLTREAAETLQQKAIHEGLPKDTFLWTFER